MMTKQRLYEKGFHPDLPPPASTVGVIGWLEKPFFFTHQCVVYCACHLFSLLFGSSDARLVDL